MADPLYGSHVYGLDSPAIGAAAVTKSDSTVLAQTTRALYVGGAGDLALVMADGSEVTLKAVPAGSLVPVRVTKVKAATTATDIVGLY